MLKMKFQQLFQTIKMPMKKRLRAFANNTTMHGFKELYNSKKWWMSFSWLLAVIFCCAFSIYQTYQISVAYSNSRTTMSVYPLSGEAYPLPKISIGVQHWHWINYSKVQEIGITPEMLVVFKSFLGFHISWPKKFDIGETKKALFHIMKMKNLTNIQELATALAYRNPLGLIESGHLADESDDLTFKMIYMLDECIYFMKAEPPYRYWYDRYARGFRIDQRLVHEELAKIYRLYRPYLPEIEVSENGTVASETAGLESKNEARMQYVPLLYIKSTWDPLPIYQGQEYVVSYTIRFYKYLLTSERPCQQYDDQDDPYEQKPYLACESDCEIQANMTFDSVTCFPNDCVWKSENLWPICSNGIMFGDDFDQIDGLFEFQRARTISSDEENKRKAMLNDCIRRRCLPTCEQYAADVSVILPPSSPSQSKLFSEITVRYPITSSILVNEEIEAYT